MLSLIVGYLTSSSSHQLSVCLSRGGEEQCCVRRVTEELGEDSDHTRVRHVCRSEFLLHLLLLCLWTSKVL